MTGPAIPAHVTLMTSVQTNLIKAESIPVLGIVSSAIRIPVSCFQAIGGGMGAIFTGSLCCASWKTDSTMNKTQSVATSHFVVGTRSVFEGIANIATLGIMQTWRHGICGDDYEED